MAGGIKKSDGPGFGWRETKSRPLSGSHLLDNKPPPEPSLKAALNYPKANLGKDPIACSCWGQTYEESNEPLSRPSVPTSQPHMNQVYQEIFANYYSYHGYCLVLPSGKIESRQLARMHAKGHGSAFKLLRNPKESRYQGGWVVASATVS